MTLVPVVHLEIHFTNGKQRDAKLRADKILFGRAPESKVRFKTDLVSRRHCVLAYVKGHWYVRDLDSSNGTLVNGELVKQERVKPGDVLQLGKDGPRVRLKRLEGTESDNPLLETRVIRDGPPTQQAQPKPAAARGLPWPALVGILFGFLTGLEAWAAAFPYDLVAAPSLWAVSGILTAAAEFAAPRVGWLVPTVLGLYWGIVGVALQRPSKLWPILVLLAIAHTAGFAALGRL